MYSLFGVSCEYTTGCLRSVYRFFQHLYILARPRRTLCRETMSVGDSSVLEQRCVTVSVCVPVLRMP
jgi:hypothetical protein